LGKVSPGKVINLVAEGAVHHDNCYKKFINSFSTKSLKRGRPNSENITSAMNEMTIRVSTRQIVRQYASSSLLSPMISIFSAQNNPNNENQMLLLASVTSALENCFPHRLYLLRNLFLLFQLNLDECTDVGTL